MSDAAGAEASKTSPDLAILHRAADRYVHGTPSVRAPATVASNNKDVAPSTPAVRSAHPRVIAVAIALFCALTLAAPARALARGTTGVTLRQPFASGPIGAYGQPGVPAAPPSTAAVAGALEQATGQTPSDVRSQDICPAPAPGTAACAAQAVVLRSTGARVRPRTHHFATPRVQPGAARPTVVSPATAPASSPPNVGTPAYLQQAYDLAYLSQTAGGSDTVAIVDAYNDPNAEADLANYRSSFGLPACTSANGCFRKVNENGGSAPLPAGNAGWEEEESLDLDAVSALCPKCHILFVEASSSSWTDLTTAEATAAALGAQQISNSFAGTSSAAVSAGSFSFPGVAVVAATGDSGYVGAGVDNYPAALAGVTAAGGTTLTAASSGVGARGFNESAWSLSSGQGGGSGCDLNIAKPAYQTDSGCTGRSYADVSADANPNTGMAVYDSGNGGWLQVGGTSMATPLIAAYYALTGVTTSSAQWAYGASALLNDPTSGSTGNCAAAITYICNARVGYDGPTGIGSISGAVAVGGPGVGGPADGNGANNTYTQSVNSTGATLTGGIYPNGLDTTWWVEYGTTNAYGQHTTPVDVGAGQAPVSVSGQLASLTPSTAYHYRLVAQNSSGTTYGYDYTLTTLAPGASPPANTAAPAVSGTADQGQTLSASTGTWTPAATAYTYQWQRSTDGGTTWSNISGATGTTYSPGAGDAGAYLRVVVTASNSNGQGSATSGGVGPVTLEVPIDVTAPSVTGTTTQGVTLGTNPGTWNPAATGYAYQWQRSSNGTTWSAIAGATGATYLLGSADIGSQVRVLVTASNQFGSSAGSVASSAVGPVASGTPFNTAAPAISGTPDQGLALTATAGTWNPAGTTYAYQWQRSADAGSTWANIAGATQSSYSLLPADVGDDVRVMVTATNPYGVTSLPSALVGPVIAVPPVNSVVPPVTGTPQRGYTLTAGPGTWSGTGDVFLYQWQRSTDGGTTWANITGATTATYAIAVADEAALLRVVVTATDNQGTASLASARDVDHLALPAGGHHRAHRDRHGSAREHPHRHAGHLDRRQQHLRLPVAGGRRRGLRRHRRRHRPAVHARHRGRGLHGAARRHGHQPRRRRDVRQHADGHGAQLAAGQHDAARHQRHGAAREHADRHPGRLDRDQQQLQLPVAELARRHHLGEHQWRHRRLVPAHHRR